MYDVYVKLDADGIIVAINSSAFIKNYDGWIKIDQGDTALYARAQIEYLEKGLTDPQGRFNYIYQDGSLKELTDSEKENLFVSEESISSEEQMLDVIIDLDYRLSCVEIGLV